MFRPGSAYATLARCPSEPARWRSVRRPLFLAFFLGCMVSLVTSQRLTLRLVAAGTLNLSFVPVVEIVGIFVTWHRRRVVSFSRSVDLFFLGHGPWALGMVAFAAIWAFATPEHAFLWTAPHRVWPLLVLALVWSGYIDYSFFRRVFERSRGQAILDVLTHRGISWSLGILIFGAGPLAAHIVSVIRR